MQNATLENIRGLTPTWLPRNVVIYIAYTNYGFPMRQIARELGIQPSTVSRTITKVSNSLNDPLFRAGLKRIMFAVPDDYHSAIQCPDTSLRKNSTVLKKFNQFLAEDHGQQGCKRPFRESINSSHLSAVSQGTESSPVIKDNSKGSSVESKRSAHVLSETLLSGEFLELQNQYKTLSSDTISGVHHDLGHQNAISVKQRNYQPIIAQSMAAQKTNATVALEEKLRLRALIPQGENKEPPLMTLARTRDKTGKIFLSSELVAAGLFFREDFELSKLISSNKEGDDKIVACVGRKTCSMQSKFLPIVDPASRLHDALNFLGPELFDVAVRCCCLFQGMQKIEKDLGWPARSGKIVLRIALMQLSGFYSGASKQ